MPHNTKFDRKKIINREEGLNIMNRPSNCEISDIRYNSGRRCESPIHAEDFFGASFDSKF